MTRYGFGCDTAALFPGDLPAAEAFADLVNGGLDVVMAGDAANYLMGYVQGLYDAGQIQGRDMDAFAIWLVNAWPGGDDQSPDACYHYQRGYIEASYLGGRINGVGYMDYMNELHRAQAAAVARRKDLGL